MPSPSTTQAPWVTRMQREAKYAAKQRADFTLGDRIILDAALRADPRQVVCDECSRVAGKLRFHRPVSSHGSPKGM